MSTEILADPMDWRRTPRSSGLLAAFNAADVLTSADIAVATRCCALAAETDEVVALAVALAVRALREGSVCVDLMTVTEDFKTRVNKEPVLDALRRQAVADGMRPLRLAGALRVAEGLTTIDAVLSTTPPLD